MGIKDEFGISEETISKAIREARGVTPLSVRLGRPLSFTEHLLAPRIRETAERLHRERIGGKYLSLLDEQGEAGSAEEWLDVPSLDVQACEVEHALNLGQEWHDFIKHVIEGVTR